MNSKRPNFLRRNGLLLIIVLTLLCYQALAQNQTAKVTPGNIWYYEYLPPDYNSNTNKYPIVFFLHGLGERGNTETDLSLVSRNGPPKHVKNGYKFPFILISPQLKTNYGGWPNSYIDAVVEHCKTYLRIDLSRVYLTGLSLGGGGAWGYSQDAVLGQKLAAVAVICGSSNNLSKACNFGLTNLPVWAFHGDADGTVSVNKTINMVNAINACTPAPNPLAKLTIYPGVGHNSWDRAYLTDNSLHTPNVYQWLMQFKNGGVIANAGNDITINLPTNSTSLTVTATTESGTISSYAWTKVSGPTVTMGDVTKATLNLTNLLQGVYVFRVTVTNSLGDTATDDVKVTVLQANQSPTANAGPDVTLTLPTNTVNLIGSGNDPDGTIASYQWAKVSGPSVNMSGQTTATLNLTNLVQGTYTFSLTVTDNQGSTGSDQVIVTVNPAVVNQLPMANAGPDKTVNLPANTTTLTGSGSDPDGSIASYLWEKVSGPTVDLTNASSQTVTLSNLVAGVYNFRLTVTDNAGGKGTDDVIVTVMAANQNPIVNAGVDITITLPTNSTNLTAIASDPDGSIASYSWVRVSGPSIVEPSNPTGATTSISGLVEGTYVYRVTVTDNQGATASDEINIIVNAAVINIPPVANAGGNKTINLPTNSTTLNGSGSDSDGSVASYLWTKVGGPDVTMTNTTSPTLSLSNLVEGVYQFQLTVTDNAGATGNATATVTVININQSPSVNAGPDLVITLPTNTANITANASDPDGTIQSYLWEQLSGPSIATLSNSTTATITVDDLLEGVYQFKVTVVDNQGASSIDDVRVTVNAMPVNETPIVDAGADRTLTLPTNSATINATAVDNDGTITSYLWTLVSGPTCDLAGTTSASLNVANMVAGTYTFRITVTDNQGASASDDIIVVVQPASVNQSPVVNAGPDIVLTLPTDNTTLNGSATDPDGTIASFLWTKVSGGNATMTNENTSSLQLSALEEGVYVFELIATDNLGATASDFVQVSVNSINVPPVANAGSDLVITLPVNSTPLIGSGSDPDGTIVSYLWTQLSGPSTATLTNDDASTATAENLIEGTYIFRLTVTDDDGATAMDEVKVVVNDINIAPTVAVSSNRNITLPTNRTTFTANASDSDGTIVSYSWEQISGPVAATLANQNTRTVTVTITTAGTYFFRVTVTDNEGTTAFADGRLIVNPESVNQPPTANAGANQSIRLPINSVVITGSGSDVDGTIASYLWTKLSGPTHSFTNANTSTVTASSLVEGTYIFRLTVTDNRGATGFADVTVTVLPEIINSTPTANAGPDLMLTLPTNSTNLTGTGSDVDGTIISYLWEKISGPAVTLTNQNNATATASDLVEGTYIFRLTVTDNQNATGTDEVQVRVNAAVVNQAPLANAGEDKSITLPTNAVTVIGSGSDADGSIVSYQWSKVSGPSASASGLTTATLSLTNLLEGTYVYRLTVTDNGGLTGTDDVRIVVFPAAVNQIPVANAGPDKTITLPINSTTLFGSGSDADGTITQYVWIQVSGTSVTLANETTTNLTVSNLIAGTFEFRLTVTDDKGATHSDNVILIVNPELTNQPPVANAGGNRSITLPTNSITLNGSGTDADGTIVKFTWTKVSGPTVTMPVTNQANLSLTNLVQGTYVFRLTVEDNNGATHSNSATVTVQPAAVNQNPIANAGPDRTITEPTSTVTLQGSESDPDGTVASRLWTQVAGATTTLTNQNTLTLTVNGLVAGTYRYRLTVTDNQGATAFDEAIVTVQPANTNINPVANAGPDQTKKLPDNTTTFVGSGTDSDGTIESYLWTKVSGPTYTPGATNLANFNVSNLVEGVYVFILTVTDYNGASHSDLVQLTVLPADLNSTPTANAGENVFIELPQNIITLTGSATDDDGSIVSVSWEKVSGPGVVIKDGITNENALNLQSLEEGVYVFRFTVTDNGGLTDYDEVSVTVFPAVIQPGEPVVDVGADITLTLPDNSVTLTAQANAPEGLIVSYEWIQVAGAPVILQRSDTAIVNLENLIPGEYRFIVTVKDGEGRQASDEIIIRVIDPFKEEGPVKPVSLFSPDGRGNIESETWYIDNASLLDGCEIVVYNRMGQRVFQSIGYPVPWNGTVNNQPVPDGAYYYFIKCNGQITQSGSITIARMK